MEFSSEIFDDYRNINHSLISSFISASKNVTLDNLKDRTEIILSNFAKSTKQNLNIINISSTGKSIFGIIELNGTRRFFKIASAERIFGEIKGYISANHYPQVGILNCYFDNNGAGVLIQPEFPDLEKKLFLYQSNKNLEHPTEEYIEASNNISLQIGEIYRDTLIELESFEGANDDFFAKRLLSGGNMEKFYGKNGLKIGEHHFNINELEINGVKIGDLIIKAKGNLDSSKKRLFIESQGDPTEANIAFPNNFFDFETGGINALSQDIAIFLIYSFCYGHFLVPRKNHFESALTEDVLKFKSSIITDYSVTDSKLNINTHFPIPNGKKKLISQYIKNVISPIEKIITQEQLNILINEVKSAIFMRFFAVKNLNLLSLQEQLVMLSMTSHFCDEKKFASLTDYFNDKFRFRF